MDKDSNTKNKEEKKEEKQDNTFTKQNFVDVFNKIIRGEHTNSEILYLCEHYFRDVKPESDAKQLSVILISSGYIHNALNDIIDYFSRKFECVLIYEKQDSSRPSPNKKLIGIY